MEAFCCVFLFFCFVCLNLLFERFWEWNKSSLLQVFGSDWLFFQPSSLITCASRCRLDRDLRRRGGGGKRQRRPLGKTEQVQRE
jgi:hypothetical protein